MTIVGLFITCTIVWIFYSGTSCAVIEAQITLTSNIQNGSIVCPNSEIVFTCETRGSVAIAWRSDAYVGDQIGFFAGGYRVGSRKNSSSNPNTVATLTKKDLDNRGVQVLESTLRIVASLNSPDSSVTCVYTRSRDTRSFSFRVLADPGEPQEIISNQTMDAMGRCVLHLAWSSPSNIAIEHIERYLINIDGNDSVTKTKSNNSTRNLFSYSVCTCGPHTVSISAVNICHRMGPSTPEVTLFPKPLSSSTCPALDVTIANATTENMSSANTTTADTANPTGSNENPEKTSGCSAGLIVVIVFLAIIVVILLLVVAVLVILWCTGTPPPKWCKTQASMSRGN